jgi:hypothetical protein
MKNVIALSFDTNATQIINAHRKFDAASSKLSTVITRELSTFVDAWSIANDRSEESCKALQAAIVDCDAVLNIVASGAMFRKTFIEYAQSAARALHFGLEFSPSLKNDASLSLPWSKKGKSTGTTKSGGVTSTTRDDLDKTISKALAQMRLLGLTELAADTLDLMIDRLDGFKETILAK